MPAIDISRLMDRGMWQAFLPHLHIEDAANLQEPPTSALDAATAAAIREQFKTEGYIHASNFDWGVDMNAMAQAVLSLAAAGAPPVFAFVYDEFWLPFRRLKPLYELLLGNYAMLPDVWMWKVDPKKNEAGWPPHRDKGRGSLFPDRSPKSLTAWIPLTTATPLNGCIYVLPAMFDPVYGTEQDNDYKMALPHVRALPAKPGDFLMWTHALLHWGSQSSPRAPENRISMAIEFQRVDVPPYREPLLNPDKLLTFESRLALIARQFGQYKHMDASEEFEAAVRAIEQQLDLRT